MSIYSVVNKGYDVSVAQSFDKMFDEHLANATKGFYLDGDRRNVLTKNNLWFQLRDNSVAHIYIDGREEWLLKIRMH